MADIFLSYAREDLAKARLLAAALEKQGWSVFWDRTSILPGQDFDEVIERAISEARCLIVGWSAASKKSDWVRGEATIARERRILLPVLFETVEPPIAFRSLHTEDFSDWNGQATASEFRALCKAIDQRVRPDSAPPETATTSARPSAVEAEAAKPVSNSEPPTKSKKTIRLTLAASAATLGIYLSISLRVGTSDLPTVVDAPRQENPTAPQPLIAPSASSLLVSKAQPLIRESTQLLNSQQPGNDKLKPPVHLPKMVNIPAGEFWMGSSDKDPLASIDETPRHKVKINAFAIGKTEVTFEQFDEFAEATGRKKPGDENWGRGRRPVIHISFRDAKAYANWLSEQTGQNYRLPTEAEWEYAARAGSNSVYWWGDSVEQNRAVCAGCGSQWDNKSTAPVGSFSANKFGLFDTAGNVWEWTADCWHDDYLDSPFQGSVWLEQVGGDCSRRVSRGGSWYEKPDTLRPANRWEGDVNLRDNNLGFRVARDM